jgi:alkylation response protein AidB-like acyl-CoA dehydrogenase
MEFPQDGGQRELRAAVAEIAGKFGGGYYAAKAAAGEPTTELWQALGAAGFIGVNIPEEYGGGGAGLSELTVVCEAAAEAGCPLLLLLVSSAISGEMITRYGTAEQRARWLPPLASGQAKMAFAITEPDAGSNSHQLATTARPDGDEWLLTGTKYYISGVDEAQAVLVVTRTGTDPQTGRGRLSLFVVDTDAPGLVRQPLPVSAQLPEKQFTVFFDGVRVGPDRLVGGEGTGFEQLFHGLNPERITGAAIAVGVGRHVLDRAAEYARTRAVWGTPIGAHQGIAHALAKAKIAVETAALVTERAAWLHDHGQPAGEAANMAKYAAAEAALAAVDAAIQTHGGNGLSAEYGLVPYWGLARLLKIAPVSAEMILNYIAQHSLSLPRSYGQARPGGDPS